ncbi:MAG: thiolase domain-containing protein, partial [Chloroflexi bacterium]|nr:thiolase domain-containing protein [Chloroflexota bacterium]
MRSVSIVGIGRTAVAEHWALSLRDLAAEAAEAAYVDADRIDSIDMLFVGNMLAGELSRQEQLGALVAETAGLSGIEAIRVEAGDASGGAALRQ